MSADTMSSYSHAKEVIKQVLDMFLINVLTEVVYDYAKTLEFDWRRKNLDTYGHSDLEIVVFGDKTREEHVTMCYENIIRRRYILQGTQLIFCTNDGLGIFLGCWWPNTPKVIITDDKLNIVKMKIFDFNRCPRDFITPIPWKELVRNYAFQDVLSVRISSIIQMDGYCEVHTEIAVILIDDHDIVRKEQ